MLALSVGLLLLALVPLAIDCSDSARAGETQLNISSTDRPSRASVSVLISDDDDSLTDAIIQFDSNVTEIEAEHRCTADDGGGRVMTLDRIATSSSFASSISFWKLDSYGEKAASSTAIIECSALQRRGKDSPTVLSSATASWSSRTRLGWSFVTPFAFGFSAAAVSVGILIAALVVLGVIRCATRRSDSTGGATVPGGSQPEQIGLANRRVVQSQQSPAELRAPGAKCDHFDYELEAA